MLEIFRPFPTLHPLIVHIPIVLMPLTPLLLLGAWRWRNKALEWVGMALWALGWAGALAASRIFHPHTDSMTLLAQDALRLHELWADWAQGLGAVTLLALLSLQIEPLSRLRSLKMLALALALAGALSVTVAGHYGALLTHVHRVTVEP